MNEGNGMSTTLTESEIENLRLELLHGQYLDAADKRNALCDLALSALPARPESVGDTAGNGGAGK